MTDQPEPLPPALLAFVEGKNAELKRHHLYARIGDYNDSRVQAVREVLNGWDPDGSTTAFQALWEQVRDATELYADKIAALIDESDGTIPGIADPDTQGPTP
jgi:hypothetical protein